MACTQDEHAERHVLSCISVFGLVLVECTCTERSINNLAWYLGYKKDMHLFWTDVWAVCGYAEGPQFNIISSVSKEEQARRLVPVPMQSCFFFSGQHTWTAHPRPHFGFTRRTQACRGRLFHFHSPLGGHWGDHWVDVRVEVDEAIISAPLWCHPLPHQRSLVAVALPPLPAVPTQTSHARCSRLHAGRGEHRKSLCIRVARFWEASRRRRDVSSIRARYLVHTSRLFFIFSGFSSKYLYVESASACDVK